MKKERDLTSGNITSGLWAFAVPLMLGNVIQQFYNLADTWIVGRYIGNIGLAAVGSSYTLMTFLTYIIIGLCLGNSTFISMEYGKKNIEKIRNGIYISFVLILAVTVGIIIFFYGFLDYKDVTGSKRYGGRYESISCLCFYRIFCHIYI